MTRGVKQPWALYKLLLLHILTSAPIISSRHVRLFIWDGKNTHDAWWWRQDSHKHTPGGPSGTEITATAARWQNRASHFGDFYHLLALLHISLQPSDTIISDWCKTVFSICNVLLYLHCKYSSVVNYCMIVQLKSFVGHKICSKRSFLCLPRQPKKYI